MYLTSLASVPAGHILLIVLPDACNSIARTVFIDASRWYRRFNTATRNNMTLPSSDRFEAIEWILQVLLTTVNPLPPLATQVLGVAIDKRPENYTTH
jgi:hypothetical protein